MKEAKEFFKKQKYNMVAGLYTCLPGRIDFYDPIANKANVLLWPDGDLIIEVPCSTIQTSDFFIRVPYKPGDPVLVVFSQRDIDGFTHGSEATPSQRMLDQNDAIVIQGMNVLADPLPSQDVGKMVIGQKDGGATITLGDGEINVTGTFKVNGRIIT